MKKIIDLLIWQMYRMRCHIVHIASNTNNANNMLLAPKYTLPCFEMNSK